MRRTVALAGNPNVGKSTVFNALTGSRQHTGNWSGKTVACAEGRLRGGGLTLTDLPGTYSLRAHSEEERAAREFLVSGQACAVVLVADAGCLERSLILCLQVLEVQKNAIMCLNLMDEAAKKGIEIDVAALELPPYRMPQIGRVIVRSVRDRTLFVLARAAAVAAPAGVLIWILANVQIGNTAILSHITAFLDPAARVFGIDGVILLAFILGFPANELVMPLIVMGYLSSGTIASGVDFASFRALLLANGWTVQTALCTLVLTVAHAPCSTTCLTILQETRSAKWTLAAVLIPAGVGLALCILIHCMLASAG